MPRVEDLIAKCTDAELFTQNLDENITAMEIKKENGFVTFLTDSQIVKNRILDTPEKKIGIVIWFPADIFER